MSTSPGTDVAHAVVEAAERDRKRRSHAMVVAALCGSFAVVVAIVTLAVVVFTQAGRIQDLQRTDDVARDRSECRTAYAVERDTALADVIAAIASGLAAVTTQAATRQPMTPDQLSAITVDIETKRDAYLAAAKARADYDRNGAPLPCPIPAVAAPGNGTP